MLPKTIGVLWGLGINDPDGRALEADPSFATAASNRLAALKLVTDRTPEAILATHREWARGIERDVPPRAAVRPGVDLPDRPLRLGYLYRF